jgi:hypothetical protein
MAPAQAAVRTGRELSYKNQEHSHKTSSLTARMLAVRL